MYNNFANHAKQIGQLHFLCNCGLGEKKECEEEGDPHEKDYNMYNHL